MLFCVSECVTFEIRAFLLFDTTVWQVLRRVKCRQGSPKPFNSTRASAFLQVSKQGCGRLSFGRRTPKRTVPLHVIVFVKYL